MEPENNGEKEGYICPSCMENFQTPDDLVKHHGEKHASLCPICFLGFASGEELHKHFSKEHFEKEQKERENVLDPVKNVTVKKIYDDTEDKQKVEKLKQAGFKLLQEINRLKVCLTNTDEPDSDLGVASFDDGDFELFISNDGEIVQFCVKTLKTQEIEYTVSKQLQRELEETLKKMEEDHKQLQKNLDKLSKEKLEILDGYDRLLSIKDESLRTQKEIVITK